jgi:hypothetical protein
MAMIPQITLFSWENDIEILGDLERLKTVLENLPDEEFVRKLEKERGRGRNEYPIRAMWNAVIAMIVLGHPRFADLIRELRRNAQLRWLCGFETLEDVPGPDNMSRFVTKLGDHNTDILNIFIMQSERLYELLPDFGKSLAIDSKWVWSSANRRSERKDPDGRSEADAEWGRKDYSGKRDDGSEWSKTVKCFGFKMHVLVDTKYGLPVAFIDSGANGNDTVWGKKLLEDIEKQRPHILEVCEYLMADRGYDDTELILWLKERGIKAIIDKRDMWKTETEKPLPGHEGIFYYNEHGEVFCYAEESGERHMLRPAGYDKERDALRKKCPVSHYGATCREADTCTYCKNVRIPLATDPRIFTQVDRQSYMWKRLYAARTSVERVNSRLDVSFGFEIRRVRGMKKMDLFTALVFTVMDTLAVASVLAKKPERMRSLVWAA